MKHLMGVLLLFAGSAMAADDIKLVVGEGSSRTCIAPRETARQYATIDAIQHAYELCAKSGDDWNTTDHYELPGDEKIGNPRDAVSCLPCGTTDGSKSIQGFKCSVRLLPQTCVRPATGQNAGGTFVPNADWGAKDRTSAPVKKPALARNVVLGGLVLSCEAAVTYRDSALASEMKLASGKFDMNAEKRRQDALKKFDHDLKKLTEAVEGASADRRKKIMVAVAGTAIGVAASLWGSAGVKPGTSEVEKRYVDALVGRGVEWSTFFGKYLALNDPKPDVTSLATMPVTLILALSPHAKAAGVTLALGGGAIDVATAVAEAELDINDARDMGAKIRKRAYDLVAKLQLPTIAKLNAIKNDIDKSCK